MKRIREIAWLLAAASAMFFGAAQVAGAQGVGYYDHNGYYRNGYDDRRHDDGYYGNRDDNPYRSGTLRCESRNQRTVYCRAGTRGGDVRLVSQLSRNACIRGRTWGVTGDSIWVAGGCRGRFQLGGYYGGNDRYRDDRQDNGYGSGYGYGYGNTARTVVCESRDGRYNFCGGSGYVGQVQIRRQLSNARCQFNYTWGYRNGGVWVDRGCRAEFLLY